VLLDDLAGALLVVEREQDLVETRITLAVVKEIDKLHAPDRVRLALGSVIRAIVNNMTTI